MCDRKCLFYTTENNRSIGVFVIFDEKDNNKKYAIICNYTNRDDINKIKSKLRKNCTIINLPQVQNDNHSCSVLNKIFLAEMHKFFVEDKHDVNELLNCKDKEDNNGNIALTDEVKKLFPNLYKYQQHDVEKSKNIPDEFKSYLIGTDKYNVLTNHDLNVLKPEEKQKNLNKDEGKKDKIFNLGLLREGWGMAIDFISENIDQVPLCELEIFIEIFEKQCNFFDRVISLQTNNKVSTNKDYFENRENAIQTIKQEIKNRQQNRENNGKENMCDLTFDTVLVSQILCDKTIAISPKFCEYVKRYQKYFGDTIYNRSKEISAKNQSIEQLIKNSNYQTLNLKHNLGRSPTGERNRKWVDIDENVGNIIQRVKPFEGNEAIRNGLRNEYQEKYKYNEEQEPRNTGTDDRNKLDMSSTIINLNNDTLPLNNNTQQINNDIQQLNNNTRQINNDIRQLNNNTQSLNNNTRQQLSSMQCKNCPSCNCLCSSFRPSTSKRDENKMNLQQ